MTVTEALLSMGYRQSHKWVVKQLGKADLLICAGCGERMAKDWAFDNQAPFVLDTRSKRDCGKMYYPDETRYRPLCRPCHRAFDKGVEPDHCENGHLIKGHNAYIEPGDPKKVRRCRICKNAKDRLDRWLKKERKRLGLDEEGWLDGGLSEFVAGAKRVP